MTPSLQDRLLAMDDAPYRQLLPGVGVAVRRALHGFDATVYRPLVCSILQGEKTVTAGGRVARVGAGESIILSHPLPVVSQVTRASPDAPYVAVVALIDLAELRALGGALRPGDVAGAPGRRALSVAPTDPATLGVLARLVALADEPEAVDVLLPLLRRELHYRLLRSAHGAHLSRRVHGGSHASQIARAIDVLRTDLPGPLDVDGLARSVGMSPSSFYRHFKAVTDTTPLQYRKDLRLTEARRLLQAGEHGVAGAAFAVGYESPSQFSREYHRRFGQAPSEDRVRRV